jgi:DNA-binding MarR family transcriptional regulator
MPRAQRQSISDLTAHLGYWLRYVSNHVSLAFAHKLEGCDVTVAEWVLMRALYGADSLAPSRLAEQLGLTRGAITRLADRLVAKDVVTRTPDPSDARAQILALTAKGRGLVPKLAALADQNDAEFFDHLSAEERSSLERVLKDIVRRRGLGSVPVD